MNVFTMIVALAAIAVVGTIAILKQVKSLKQLKPSQREHDLDNEVRSLEQRVQILERIATDKKNSLKEEIETL